MSGKGGKERKGGRKREGNGEEKKKREGWKKKGEEKQITEWLGRFSTKNVVEKLITLLNTHMMIFTHVYTHNFQLTLSVSISV